MAGKELGFLKSSTPSWKEQLARKTLRNVRLQGHTYVDLREDGKGFVFFCTLCLTPCYSDDVLFDHLRGNLHKERFSSAKKTLFGSNPWPFDDGVLFFPNLIEEEEKGVGSNGTGMVELLGEGESLGNADLSIVVCPTSESDGNGHVNGNGKCNSRTEYVVTDDDMAFDLVIPGVLGKEEVSDLRVRLTGYGQISSRVLREEEVNTGIHRLWCEWLGKLSGDDDEIRSRISSHDFGIVSFSYFYDLGKQGLFDAFKTLLVTGGEDGENSDDSIKRRKKSFSDSEDSTTSSALIMHHYDGQLLHSRIIASKSLRRELRKQQRVASEKMCDICQQKMLPGKDVAALLNIKTGKLACSSRNVHGAFHVFHASCLIHWILLCESEMFLKAPVRSKVRRRSTRKVKSSFRELGKDCDTKMNTVKQSLSRKASEAGTLSDRICSVFCPACQGTGVEVEESELENPTISLSEIFKYKIKVSDAHRSWMKSPEELDNCSTGFAFPVEADSIEEKVIHMKLLHFYRASEDCWPQSS